MKLNNDAQYELERRLRAIDSQFVRHDKITQAAMLAGIIFGAAVLVVVVSYLFCLSWITGR